MEEEEDISSPFWLQNSSTNRRRLRRSYSIFVSSGTVVIILLVITLAFILVIVPTLHSFISHIFKPNSVKKSWDSLNLLLVLFAIFCGFLSKNNNNSESPRSYEDQTFSNTNTRQEYEKPNSETETQPPPWYEYSEDRTPYNRLRSFNSYPDLRQESWWVTGDGRWRFSDDTRVNGYNRGLDLNLKEEKEETGIKSVELNTSLKGKNKKKQTLETQVNTSLKGKNKKKQTLETHQSDTIEKMKNKNVAERKNKKASATKDEKTNQSLKGKKKQQHKHKSVENFQSLLNSEPPTTMPSSSSFDDLFYSKKNKQKKHKSVSPSQHHVSSTIVSKIKDEDFSVTIGNESPLTSIPPPPPPPPPFKMPAWKFKVQGDFVRIDSISSTSSGLADIEDDEVLELAEPGINLLVYPNTNPDVDNKAGSFIESFRAGLREEKMNFMKNQGIGDSNLYNNPTITKTDNKRRN
ncbi:uncharacterized protein LOC131621891 [Vicia villosa]|uniref:uncharacterized protein LOC131621891 n=1 Tax=Vicia villosa TaxID=3911 RepID=UPI00273C14EE|nr:uncharacterized protein LOC131621891 [Vicia villosa]